MVKDIRPMEATCVRLCLTLVALCLAEIGPFHWSSVCVPYEPAKRSIECRANNGLCIHPCG